MGAFDKCINLHIFIPILLLAFVFLFINLRIYFVLQKNKELIKRGRNTRKGIKGKSRKREKEKEKRKEEWRSF